MVRPGSIPLKVTVTFTYDAEVFAGDPTDAFEVAELERQDLTQSLTYAATELVGEVDSFELKVTPE